MTDDLPSLYAYNRWADRLVLDTCEGLTPEQYTAEPVPGWTSVRSTVVHIAAVTDVWLRGVAGEFVDSFPTEADLPTVAAARRLLDVAYERFESLLPELTPERLHAPWEFRSKWRSATLPPWVVLRHVVNHATYHRGQVASKLKRIGVEPPGTDLIFWAFEQTAPKG